MIILPTNKAQIALLLAKKVTIAAKYLDFADAFLKKSANIFLKQIGANEHMIKLEQGKQPLYGPIYSLRPVEFKTFKTYIKTNLRNGFIKASKSSADTLILLVCKLNGSFCLCVNYQKHNNLIIKNQYLIFLIEQFLNRLSQVK